MCSAQGHLQAAAAIPDAETLASSIDTDTSTTPAPKSRTAPSSASRLFVALDGVAVPEGNDLGHKSGCNYKW